MRNKIDSPDLTTLIVTVVVIVVVAIIVIAVVEVASNLRTHLKFSLGTNNL